MLACSSAGGGLRIAVVGNEELVTAEAGRRVALSSGGKVVQVIAAAGRVPETDLYAGLRHTTRADVVLLTGGTDGGNGEVIVQAARDLVASGWDGPTVVAGNVDARDEVSAVLAGPPARAGRQRRAPDRRPRPDQRAERDPRGLPLPRHRRQAPEQAGGLHRRWSAARRPDVVLTGVELLAAAVGEVVVVDVGGATTDVHSVVEVDPEQAGLARDVVAPTPVTRTVEGDLGMRWSAVSTVEEAGLDELHEAARRRRDDPGFLPHTDQEQDEDEQIARAAVSLALRRHAGRSKVVVSPEGRVVERTGVDLREVDLVVGSGGVLRHGRDGVADRVLGPSVGRDADWQLPERAQVVVDTHYVLAAAGLLAAEHPEAAHRLVASLADRLTP